MCLMNLLRVFFVVEKIFVFLDVKLDVNVVIIGGIRVVDWLVK